jgi:hypothetical protein
MKELRTNLSLRCISFLWLLGIYGLCELLITTGHSCCTARDFDSAEDRNFSFRYAAAVLGTLCFIGDPDPLRVFCVPYWLWNRCTQANDHDGNSYGDLLLSAVSFAVTIVVFFVVFTEISNGTGERFDAIPLWALVLGGIVFSFAVVSVLIVYYFRVRKLEGNLWRHIGLDALFWAVQVLCFVCILLLLDLWSCENPSGTDIGGVTESTCSLGGKFNPAGSAHPKSTKSMPFSEMWIHHYQMGALLVALFSYGNGAESDTADGAEVCDEKPASTDDYVSWLRIAAIGSVYALNAAGFALFFHGVVNYGPDTLADKYKGYDATHYILVRCFGALSILCLCALWLGGIYYAARSEGGHTGKQNGETLLNKEIERAPERATFLLQSAVHSRSVRSAPPSEMEFLL